MTIGPPTVGIRDTSLTEGQLCVWQGAMTNDMLLPILPRMDRAGFASIELLDPAAFSSCVRLTGEDPWERIRLAAKRLDSTPAAVSLSATSLFGEGPASTDDGRRTVRDLARSGISLVQIYDPVNDVDRLATLAGLARDAGLGVVGGLVFALCAAHDDPYFVDRARKLAALGCEAVALLDFAGILHPERARDLVPALHAALGSTPLEIRTHCRSGRAEITCFAALENGAATVHCACEALAGGDSVPSSDYFMEHLAREGYAAALDGDSLAAVSDYFGGIADLHGFPAPVQRLHDPQVDRDQFPVELEWQRNPPSIVPKSDRQVWDVTAETPLQQLMAELERRPWVARLRVSKGEFTLETAKS